MPSSISPEVRQRVRERADYLCEYCHTSEQWQYVPFTVDHVVPTSQEGTGELNNLALACFHCNRQKSNQVSAADPVTGEEAPLFNPRQENWSDHFIWSSDGLRIIGRSPTGRATVEALRLNRERIVRIRATDVEVKRHPPMGDPIREVSGR